MKREDIDFHYGSLQKKEAEEILRHFLFAEHSSDLTTPGGTGRNLIALASSLGAEDQALTHMVLSIRPDARIFVLDTGRFHNETYELMEATMKRYGMRYEILFPEAAGVEEMESRHGPNLFYKGYEQRKRCCLVRKVQPLRRVLSSLDVWITGLRKEQAVTRNGIEKIAWDEGNGLLKLNPLADWSEEQVWEYIRRNDIPYNRLHDQGYPSIGCAPCTRAVLPGEDLRSGRWWWETPEQKECGLHLINGKLVRSSQ